MIYNSNGPVTRDTSSCIIRNERTLILYVSSSSRSIFMIKRYRSGPDIKRRRMVLYVVPNILRLRYLVRNGLISKKTSRCNNLVY